MHRTMQAHKTERDRTTDLVQINVLERLAQLNRRHGLAALLHVDEELLLLQLAVAVVDVVLAKLLRLIQHLLPAARELFHVALEEVARLLVDGLLDNLCKLAHHGRSPALFRLPRKEQETRSVRSGLWRCKRLAATQGQRPRKRKKKSAKTLRATQTLRVARHARGPRSNARTRTSSACKVSTLFGRRIATER
jgi:hypothetical protein